MKTALIPLWSWVWAGAMAASVALSAWLTPTQSMIAPGEVDLEASIPKSFGEWTYVPSAVTQVNLALKRDDDDLSDQIYDQVLMRTYRNPKGESVMLALAWGRQQRQEVKIHRPELCYVAQGFRVEANRPFDPLGASGPAGRAMIATHPRRVEPVLYWVRIGDTISSSAWQTRLYILKEGLGGRIPDGILVRTSQILRTQDGVPASHALQGRFLRDLVDAMPTSGRALLVPAGTQKLAELSR